LTTHEKRHHNDLYVAKRKVEEVRVAEALKAAGYEEWHGPSDALPPFGTFKREHRISFECIESGRSARIDFIVAVEGGCVFLEVDEHQHRYGYNGELSCDMKRMARVAEAMVFEGVEINVRWLRYNPHAWHVDDKTRRVPKVEREAMLVDALNEGVNAQLAIHYMYYDTTEGELDVLMNEEYNDGFKKVVTWTRLLQPELFVEKGRRLRVGRPHGADSPHEVFVVELVPVVDKDDR
jgi:hypothetical protein